MPLWSLFFDFLDFELSVLTPSFDDMEIEPLAPAFNAERFTDQAKVDKWLRRNCKDVFSRECTAPEKADVLAYLLSLKP